MLRSVLMYASKKNIQCNYKLYNFMYNYEIAKKCRVFSIYLQVLFCMG